MGLVQSRRVPGWAGWGCITLEPREVPGAEGDRGDTARGTQRGDPAGTQQCGDRAPPTRTDHTPWQTADRISQWEQRMRTRPRPFPRPRALIGGRRRRPAHGRCARDRGFEAALGAVWLRSAPLGSARLRCPPAMARRSALSIRIVEGRNLPAKDM